MLTVFRYLVLLGVLSGGTLASLGLVDWSGAASPGATALAAENPSSDETDAANAGRISSGRRLVIWVLVVLLMPVVTVPFAGPVLDLQSNSANFLLLVGYTGLDALAAYIADGIHVGGILSGLFYLVVLLAVFAYNVWILAFLVRLRRK